MCFWVIQSWVMNSCGFGCKTRRGVAWSQHGETRLLWARQKTWSPTHNARVLVRNRAKYQSIALFKVFSLIPGAWLSDKCVTCDCPPKMTDPCRSLCFVAPHMMWLSGMHTVLVCCFPDTILLYCRVSYWLDVIYSPFGSIKARHDESTEPSIDAYRVSRDWYDSTDHSMW